MMDSPDISVVMSVYNNEDTLAAAMQSILTQEGVALEFIVINDGSTDASPSLLDDAARRDPRVRVFHQENQGLTRALIRGCAHATATWIARQDADDISWPGRLQRQLSLARGPGAPVLVGCGARMVSLEGDVLTELHPPSDFEAAAARLLGEGQALSPHGSILFRRDAYEAVGGYRPEFYFAQDIDLTTRLGEAGPVTAVEDILYELRLDPGSISGRHASRQSAYYRLIREGHALRKRGIRDDVIVEKANRLCEVCRHATTASVSVFPGVYFLGTCLLRDHPRRAADYFLTAWKMRPWSVKTCLQWGRAHWRARRSILS